MMVIYAKNIDKYVFKNKNRVEICGKLRCLNGSEFCESSSYIHLQYLQWPEHHSLSSDHWVAQNLAPWGNRFARAARKCCRKMLEVWRLCICALAVGCRWREINAGNRRFDDPNVSIVPEVFDVPISKVYSNMIKYGGSMCFLYNHLDLQTLKINCLFRLLPSFQ